MNHSGTTQSLRVSNKKDTQPNFYNKHSSIFELPNINHRNKSNINQTDDANRSSFNFNRSKRINMVDGNNNLGTRNVNLTRKAKNLSVTNLNSFGNTNTRSIYASRDTSKFPVELPEGALFKIDFPDYLQNDIKSHNHSQGHDNDLSKNAFTKFSDIKNAYVKTQTQVSEDATNEFGSMSMKNIFNNDPFFKIMKTLDHNYLQQTNYDTAIMSRMLNNIDSVKEKIKKTQKLEDIGKGIRITQNNNSRYFIL